MSYPKIENAIRLLELQTQRLEQVHNRLQERWKNLQQKASDYREKQDIAHARAYENEIVEIDKMDKPVITTSKAIKEVISHFESRKGNDTALFEILLVAIEVIRRSAKDVGGILPDAERELGEIKRELAITVVDLGFKLQKGTDRQVQLNFADALSAADKILPEVKTER